LGMDGSPGEPGILRDPLRPIAVIWDPWMGHISKPEIVFPRLEKAPAVKELEALGAAEREVPEPLAKRTTAMEQQPESKPAKGATAAPTPESRPSAPAPASPAGTDQKISIEDFAKVDMRVGEIVSAEAVPNTTKLLKLMVDIGTEVRQVVAGIAECYKPEQLVGMKVVLVTNLQPRKLRGVESNGMVVAATVGPEGRPVLATFKEDVPKGAKLK
jgi:methionyl-tRNA synthetase